MSEANGLREDVGRIRSYDELCAQPRPERCSEMEWNKVLALRYMAEKGHDLEMIPMWERAGFRLYDKKNAKDVPWIFLKDHKELIGALEKLVAENGE